MVDHFGQESDDEDQMQDWVEGQIQKMEEREIRRRVLLEKQAKARKARREQRLRDK